MTEGGGRGTLTPPPPPPPAGCAVWLGVQSGLHGAAEGPGPHRAAEGPGPLPPTGHPNTQSFSQSDAPDDRN